ncbi:hypothetical protein [Polaromonas sp. YR568]|uniref:hypothetical protein n=1 Tax=Polaromonas sp. YR568 TaxID=1855301 RepID=UPI00398C0F9C
MKTMTSIYFRLMLLASLVCVLIGASIDSVFPSAIPEVLAKARDAYEVQFYEAMGSGVILAGVLIFVVSGVAFAGLFFFRSWGRPLAIAGTALLLGMGFFAGVGVQSERSMFFGELGSLLWGAVLAISYLSPVKEKFAAARGSMTQDPVQDLSNSR